MTDALAGSRKLWDDHARRDPLWAILSDPSKKGGRWDLERFFQTGVGEIAYILYQLQFRGVVAGRGSALDFGCGVGRLTQALAAHFDHVVGLDISPRMTQLAAGLNQFPQRVRYASNERADLSAWGDGAFDFIVSSIVLQHIRPELTLQYLREFHRVLSPVGIMVFQLPSHERGPDDLPPPPQIRAMPDDAYQASLVVAGMPSAVRPGTEISLAIEVTNASGVPWSQQDSGLVRAGNHWLDGARHRMLLRDDGRTSLPAMLPPGHSCHLVLSITAPAEEGNYECEIDLCHEGVVWFGEKGSQVVRFPVRVSQSAEPAELSRACPPVIPAPSDERRNELPAPRQRSGHALAGEAEGTADPEPFPMYGIPKDTIVNFIAGMGDELIHAENDPSCGADWVSYRYFVRKRA